MLRAVIDTNVWISAMLNAVGAPARVRDTLRAELAEVLARPRIARKYGITNTDIVELITLLRRGAEMIPVVGDLQLCRDPDDDIVIETAIRGRADALVTRDDDLKDAPEVAEVLAAVDISVMTVRRFLFSLDEGNSARQPNENA